HHRPRASERFVASRNQYTGRVLRVRLAPSRFRRGSGWPTRTRRGRCERCVSSQSSEGYFSIAEQPNLTAVRVPGQQKSVQAKTIIDSPVCAPVRHTWARGSRSPPRVPDCKLPVIGSRSACLLAVDGDGSLGLETAGGPTYEKVVILVAWLGIC